MKHLVRNLTLVGCVGSSAFAAPFLAIGDNAELFVTADAIASYNDNILLSADAPGVKKYEDTIFTFRPGFDLEYGKDSAIKGNLVGTYTMTGYSQYNEFNNQLFGIGANGSYSTGGRLTLNANASFNELDQPTVDLSSLTSVGKLVEREVTDAGINGEYAFSEKISVGSGFAYSHVDFEDPAYSDQWTYTVPVNVYYELTPKVDLSAGVRYTRTDQTVLAPTAADQFDSFYYNVGARGAFTPKLSGNFSVGYNTRYANRGPDDDGSIGANASLAYAYSDKTQLSLALSRDFANSTAGGSSYENSQITLSAVSAITVDWRLNASATYRLLDYTSITPSQTEEYYEGSLGATYIINNHLSSSLSYTYREKSSDAGTLSEFQNNLVTLSLSARY